MAKTRKKREGTYKEAVARDQKNFEEGVTSDAGASHDAEVADETQSKPSKKRNDSVQVDAQHEEQIREGAREVGEEVSPKANKDVAATVIKEARRKSQANPGARVTRKEPSRASASGAVRGRKPMKKKSAGMGSSKKKNKSKAKAR